MADNAKTFKIEKIQSYEVLDSRGFPTVATKIYADGLSATAMVPSGASTGEREAVELRDNDKTRFNGKGVLKAVSNVNDIIAEKIIGLDVRNQKEIDQIMIDLDGTPNKAKLGANAILSVSLGIAKLAAKLYNIPLYKYIRKHILKDNNDQWVMPVPMLNVINGGAHADNTIDFQEFMFMPVGAKSITQAIQIAAECFHSLQTILKSKKMNTNKGDEGGFAPNLKDGDEALSLMVEAVQKAGYEVGVDKDVAFALDPATSELYDDETKTYTFTKALKANILLEHEAKKSTKDMVTYWHNLCNKYPIVSIEDGIAENDWDGFNLMVKAMGKKVQIVGDDLFCTNPKIVKEGIQKNVANAVLIKINQIGTLSETFETIRLAHKANWSCVVSHRSGETEDTSIADIAVALNTGQIKTGSMSRSERIAKYNRLIAIEKELGDKAVFLGKKTFKHFK